MHRNFVDWYRSVHPEPPTELINAKWKVVESSRRKKDASATIPDLVRLAFGRPILAGTPGTVFEEAVRKTEPDVPLASRPREVAVLAGATLIVWIEQGDFEFADRAAFMTISLHCEGRGPSPILPDVLNAAYDRIIRRQKARGTPTQAPLVQRSVPAVPQMVTLKNPESQSYLLGNAGAVNKMLAAIAEAASGVSASEATNHAVQSIWIEIRRLREETNILWWLFGERSVELKRPIAELTGGAAALVVGKELAGLVEDIPGPLAAPAFVERMLRLTPSSDEPMTLDVALRQSDPATLEPLAALVSERIADLLPIHSATKLYREAGGDPAWKTMARTRLAIDADAEFQPTALAQQVYHERLLLAALNGNP